jgi:5'-methylthioadenosine phosphorylase
MLIRDHINLSGGNPLIGQNLDEFGPRFPDMCYTYDADLRRRLTEAASAEGITLAEGVYTMMSGPTFETPAEIKMFKMLGGDLVGMTGVPEVTLAREREICYNSICIVSNYASGISEEELTIDEVFEMVAQKEGELLELIYNFIKNVDDSEECSCNHALDGAEV